MDSLIALALQDSRDALEQMAVEVEPAKFGEIKHFTPAFVAALRGRAGRSHLDPTSVRSYPLRVSGWPSKANVDVSVRDHAGALALIELKWDALSECVWDVAKLALAIAEEQATFGYVVAGAREKTWSDRKPGTELFDSADHAMSDLRSSPYRALWDSWERKGDPIPLQLPRVVRIASFRAVDVDLRGEPWQLRCASIDADPGHVEDVDDLDERWREHLSPAAKVFYDPKLTDEERRRRLTALAEEESMAGGHTADAAGYLASSARRRSIDGERAGEQGDDVDEDAVARMIAKKRFE